MNVVYTDQSLNSQLESLEFLVDELEVPPLKAQVIITNLLDKADGLAKSPFIGQYEEYLAHLEKGHRRLIEGNFKIIYRVEDETIFITDFFDTRQDPTRMKS